MGGIPWQLALIWIGHKLRGGPSALHTHLWEKRELVTRLPGGDLSMDMCTAKSAAKRLAQNWRRKCGYVKPNDCLSKTIEAVW
ncbi:hypothetical protein M405DRAFT_817538 [Rhizopogon salebrosus TDB-379]|nr:hypothetical protein M405DRAFT_817538 [Rhizopogon salebrosus TDB-379]